MNIRNYAVLEDGIWNFIFESEVYAAEGWSIKKGCNIAVYTLLISCLVSSFV